VRSAWFFGLPGNPVSTVVTFLLLVRPALLAFAGEDAGESFDGRFQARLATAISHKPGREEYQRGRLRWSSSSVEVSVTGDQSSNRLATFMDADCLIRVPKNAGDLGEGTLVTVLPLRGLI
jgi:molybdopterin molybdotransferase